MDADPGHIPENELIVDCEEEECLSPSDDSVSSSPVHIKEGQSGVLHDDNIDPDRSSNSQSPTLFSNFDVIKAIQIENLLYIHRVVLTIGVVCSLLKIVFANKLHLGIWKALKDLGCPQKEFHYSNYVVHHIMFSYAIALSIIFNVVLFSLRRSHVTDEQKCTVFLLIAISCYLLPMRELFHLLVPTFGLVNLGRTVRFPVMLSILNMVQRCTFTAATVLYVWLKFHAYETLEKKITASFYAPKIFTLSIYVAAKVFVMSRFKIYSAEVLLGNLSGMLSLFYAADKWDRAGLVYAFLISAVDLMFLGYSFLKMRRTKAMLSKADYLHNRSTQIGFRFFMYRIISFSAAYLFAYVSLQITATNDVTVLLYRNGGLSNFGIHRDLMFGLHFMLLSFATIEAYLSLPAEGWSCPSTANGLLELAPFTYRKNELPSPNGGDNCFIMQTHVVLFNFAWLVYYWDTPKVNSFKLTQDVFKFQIAAYIKDKPTDTHALVIDGSDRIVVAFKGTTSKQNLKTDINVFYSRAKTVIPTKLGDLDPEGNGQALSSRIVNSIEWGRAKIHKGFATAYRAVAPELLSAVKKLLDEKRRPVFLTGHSLGGALATLCSLDLLVRLQLSPREIIVSTFGGPRVGNRPFQKTYDAHVPIHWRVVVRPDLVAKLPKIGFVHVGVKVLLTVDGNMFIDPNSLELDIRPGDAASMHYHRKASYLLAMRAWCERHHGVEYVPEFWPFPVSTNDVQRLHKAMSKKNLEHANSVVMSVNLQEEKLKKNGRSALRNRKSKS